MLTLDLDSQAVDLPSDAQVALTLWAHDLRSSSTREGGFSETFTLPPSARNSAALGAPHVLGSLTDTPYRKLSAVLRANSVPVLIGTALLETSSNGYEVTLYSTAADLFTAVGERQLRELDLSAYDHVCSLAAVQAAQSATGAYTYPLVDDGRLTLRYPITGTGVVHYSELSPAVFTRTVLAAIVADALPGYRLSGSLLADPIFARHQLLAGAIGPQRRQAYLDAHTLEAATDAVLTYATNSGTPLATDITFAQRLSDPGNHLATRPDGTTQYVTPNEVTDYRVQLTAEVTYQGTGAPYVGTQRATVVVSENGLAFYEEVLFEGSWPDAAAPQTRILRLDKRFTRSAGPGEIRVQVVVENRMQVSLAVGARLTVTPGARAYDRSPVHLDAGLPDWSQADLLQLVCNSFNALVQVDAVTRLVRFDLANDLERNRRRAVDWTAKVDRSVTPVLHYRLDELAARNVFAYAEAPSGYDALSGADEVPAALLVGTDTTLEAEAEAYTAPAPELRTILSFRRRLTLPFTSQFQQPTLALFELWRPAITYTTDYYVLDRGRYWQAKQLIDSTYPRPGTNPTFWRLVEESELFAPADDAPFVGLYQPLLAPPDIRVGAGNNDPGFATTAGVVFDSLAFADLLSTYYPGTAALLARVRWLGLSVTLTPSDIAGLDFTVPVRLAITHWQGVGAIQGLFYLNLVDQWGPDSGGGATAVELVLLGDPVPGLAPAADPLPERPLRPLRLERGGVIKLENVDTALEEQ